MLYDTVQSTESFSDRLAMVTTTSSCTWGELSLMASQCRGSLASFSGRRVGLIMLREPATIAGLAASQRVGINLFLLDGQAKQEVLQQWVDEFSLAAVVRADSSNALVVEPTTHTSATVSETGVTILTSGTEGRPKAARHRWDGLMRPIRRTDDTRPQRWSLSFRLHLYAGMQVTLQCLVNHGTLVMPDARASPDEVVTMMRNHQVQYTSATPSYWRRLVLSADRDVLASVPLRQITLGGEAVDQPILDALAGLFPQARIAHIYASTELGRCFSVTDRKAGFPASLLEGPTADGVEMRIKNGELWVRSANRMDGYVDAGNPGEPAWAGQGRAGEGRANGDGANQDGALNDPSGDGDWIATGDLLHQDGNRLFFAGRQTEMINVGGMKISPLAVEQVIRSVPGVADARVYAKSSSIAGQLVACDLVLEDDANIEQVKQDVALASQDELAAAAHPRLVRIVDTIDLTAASKVSRME